MVYETANRFSNRQTAPGAHLPAKKQSGIKIALSQTDKLRIVMRSREVRWRTKELTRKIEQHKGDKDYRRSLHDWRKELLDLQSEQATSGLRG